MITGCLHGFRMNSDWNSEINSILILKHNEIESWLRSVTDVKVTTPHLKVWTTCGEHNFMGMNLIVLGQQCHIHQLIVLQERRKHRHHIRLVIIPAQTKLSSSRHFRKRAHESIAQKNFTRRFSNWQALSARNLFFFGVNELKSVSFVCLEKSELFVVKRLHLTNVIHFFFFIYCHHSSRNVYKERWGELCGCAVYTLSHQHSRLLFGSTMKPWHFCM